MRYPATITSEDDALLASFPDCPGCVTFTRYPGGEGRPIAEEAAEALTGWLETHLVLGYVPPRPRRKAQRVRKPGSVMWIDVAPSAAIPLTFLWARVDAGLTQAELAKRARVARKAVAELEHPDGKPSLETMMRVAKALGMRLGVTLNPQ